MMLRIVRRSGYADGLRAYKIFVNGAHVGNIAPHAVLDLDIPNGPLTIQARVDWCRSQPLEIESTASDRIEVEVSNNWGALLGIWGSTFGFRNYLALKRLPSGSLRSEKA
jgi:hypothetical protein